MLGFLKTHKLENFLLKRPYANAYIDERIIIMTLKFDEFFGFKRKKIFNLSFWIIRIILKTEYQDKWATLI